MDNSRYLFRGKDEIGGEFVIGYLQDLNNGKEPYTMCIRPLDSDFQYNRRGEFGVCAVVDTTTIGQCTGFKDKNGVLIFEHDILEYAVDNKVFKVRVNWCTVSLSFRVYDSCDEKYRGELLSITSDALGNCLVIGNIHDNGMAVSSNG